MAAVGAVSMVAAGMVPKVAPMAVRAFYHRTVISNCILFSKLPNIFLLQNISSRPKLQRN